MVIYINIFVQELRKIVSSFGPLRAWWSDVARLNAASGHSFLMPREWESLILQSYRRRYNCLPLKNRKC